MKINEVAKLTGVTVRTLHYYDQIGLLHPSETTQTGYRIYHQDALEKLQQILFFRELEFPLSDIREIMSSQCYDRQEILAKHKELLMEKRKRLDALIDMIDTALEEETCMDIQDFDINDLNKMKKKYAEEVRERWGETEAYRESEQKTAGYDDQRWNILMGEGGDILKAFADNRHLKPDSKEAQELVKRWQAYITNNFYHCTNEILYCLGLMYVEDKRFTENIDRNGKGTAEFMGRCIEYYCTK